MKETKRLADRMDSTGHMGLAGDAPGVARTGRRHFAEHAGCTGHARRASLAGRMGGLLRWPLAMATALALLCGTSLTAYAAADSPSLDWSQSGNGSIAVELEDDAGNAVVDGTLTLYQVALLEQDDGNMAYALAEAFAGCGVSLDDVSADSSSLAAELADYAAANGITGMSVENADGTVVFDGLELGLYLVVQTTQSDGYYTMNPFVVSVPLDEDGAWVYDKDDSLKEDGY